MATLVFSALQNLMLDRCQANVTIDGPTSAAEIARFLNEAYADMWEIEGGGITQIPSATAWTSAQLATGIVTGILTDINEIMQVFASTTSGSTGNSTGDVEVVQRDYSYVQWLRKSSLTGAYAVPKVCAVRRLATTTPASVGLHQLDYWPSVTGFYFPIHYQRQFTEIDAATVTTPDLTDIGSRDLGLIAASRLAPLLGRAELVPGIMADISARTAKAMERKFEALLSADQDK